MGLFVNLYVALKAALSCCYYFVEVQTKKAVIKIKIIIKYLSYIQVLI